MRIEFTVYLVGVILLGLVYEPVKHALGGRWLFLGVVTLYALMLRLVGAWLSERRRPATDE